MNTAITIMIILTLIFTIAIIGYLLYSLKYKAYLSYKQKLINFEEKKKRIEEDLKNDRKRFKRNS
jgi:anionic cell wall polymer biosynthesis LytR-Cps2A-Psr (LCP) family protein